MLERKYMKRTLLMRASKMGVRRKMGALTNHILF